MKNLALLLLLGYPAVAQTSVDPARVDRLLQRAAVIDLHDDTTQMILDEAYNLGEKHDYGQVDIPRMRSGHISGQVDIPRMRSGHISGLFLSIWTDTDRYTPVEAIRRTLQRSEERRVG